MDDAPSVPLVFANRVIRQFADHLLGSIPIKPRDFTLMRLVFRAVGGNWDKFIHGDIDQITTLENIVTRWGKKQKPPEPDVEQVVV